MRCKKQHKFILLIAIFLCNAGVKTIKKYDGIYSCKVYQHFELELVEKALTRQSEMLNNEGVVIHSFWIGDTVFDDGDMRALYHNKEKLLAIINKHFTLLEQVVYEEFEPHDSIFILAKKK